MSLHFNDVIKQGYVKIKGQKVGVSWSNYILARTPVSLPKPESFLMLQSPYICYNVQYAGAYSSVERYCNLL